MSAVAKIHEPTLPGIPDAPQQAVTIMDIISRAAFDPSVDGDKIERLLRMAREFKADDAKAAYARAMVKMKPKLPVIDRKGRITIHEKGKEKTDANIIQSTPYALWEDIDAAITPILAEHGFVLTFRTGAGTGAGQEGRITVTGVLTHEMGHSEESTMPLPLDTSGSKNNVQAAGSSTSYGKRYTATALLNIRTKGEDDDGQKGGDPGTISEEQAERILELLTKDSASVPDFCKYMTKILKLEIGNVLDIPAAQFSRALEVINTRSQKVKEKAEGGK